MQRQGKTAKKDKIIIVQPLSKVEDLSLVPLQCRRPRFNPWVRKIPWRREWLPTPVFLPGESHGQRSPAGYSPWGLKESDRTEQVTLSLSRAVDNILSYIL